MRSPGARLSRPEVMAHVDIPLNQLRYRFRSLKWREEIAIADLKLDATQTVRKHLSIALTTVTAEDGRVLDIPHLEDAERIIVQLTTPILNRFWLLYRAGLPTNRFFTTRRLFRAPEPRAFVARIAIDEGEREERADAATRQMEARFGGEELRAAKEVDRQIFEDAKRRNILRPFREDV